MRRSVPICLVLVLTLACGGDGPTDLPDAPEMDPAASPSGDVRPPTLVSVGFSPKNVSVSRDSELVSILARVRDEGSGIDWVAVQFRNPEKASISAFTELALFRGDAHNGRYEGFILIPRGAPGGEWELMFVQAADEAGNMRVWGTEELEERGIPVVLRVSSG